MTKEIGFKFIAGINLIHNLRSLILFEMIAAIIIFAMPTEVRGEEKNGENIKKETIPAKNNPALSSNALQFQQKRVLQGEFSVDKLSPVPNPAKSDYPDCYCAVLCSFNGKGKKQEIVLLVKCFENYKYTKMSQLKEGDKIRAKLIPFDDLPEQEKSIQRSDSLERYDLDIWVASDILLIKEFTSGSSVELRQSNNSSSNALVENPPISSKMKADIRQLIKEDLAKINEQIGSRGERDIVPCYTEDSKSRLEKCWQTKNSAGLLYWKGDSLVRIFHIKNLPSEKNEQYSLRGVDVVTEFDRELKKRNVRFICVSFPAPWEIYLSRYCTNVSDLQSFSMRRLLVLRKLLENGVEVIDLGYVFKQQFSRYPYFSDVIANDSHPMDYGIEVLADLLVKRLSDFDFSSHKYDSKFFTTSSIENIRHLSFPKGNSKFKGKYFVKTWINRVPKKIQRRSPILVVGDSFSVTPWGTTGLRGVLGNRMKMLVDGYQNQSGATRILRTISGRKYCQTEGRRVVLYVIAPGAWSSAQWEPLVVSDRPKTVIWELKNISDKVLKNNNALKKQGDRFSLSMRSDFANEVGECYSSMFSVQIPRKYLDSRYKLFVEAETYASRIRLIQRSNNNSPVLASGPTGIENDYDNISLEINKEYIESDSKNRLLFDFNALVLRDEITIRNIRVFVK